MVQKIKIICLKWNLFPKQLMWVCRIQGWYWLYRFLIKITLFGQICFKKIKITSLSLNLIPRLIGIPWIHWWCSLFLFSIRNTFLDLDHKIKNVNLNWNLVPKLIWIFRIQWWCSHFLFFIWNTLLGKIWSKKTKLFI